MVRETFGGQVCMCSSPNCSALSGCVGKMKIIWNGLKLEISPSLFDHHKDANNPKMLTPPPQSVEVGQLRLQT